MKRMLLKICNNENGMTIPELLIAMGIMTLTLAGAFSLLQLSEASWNSTTNRMNTRDDAARKMSAIVKTLRGAEDTDTAKGLLEVADKNNIVFYANIDVDDEPEKIQYQLSGTNLVRTITQPLSATKPWIYSGSVESTVAASNLTNNSSNPVFSYYLNGYSVALPASLTDRKLINEIKINLSILKSTGNKSESMTLETHVFLRNLR